MPIAQGTASNFNELTTTGVDANASSVTDKLELRGAINAAMYTIADTGASTTHVVTIQVSPDDGTTWFDTTHTVLGIGMTHDNVCIGTHIRAKVTIVEGAPSTIDIILIIK